MIDFRKMWLTGLHKAGVGPSHQTAEKVKPRKLPDTDAAVGRLQPKSDIYAPYLDLMIPHLHSCEDLLVVRLAISHPCLHLETTLVIGYSKQIFICNKYSCFANIYWIENI